MHLRLVLLRPFWSSPPHPHCFRPGTHCLGARLHSCQIDRLSLPRAAGRPDTCSYSYTPSYSPPTQMFSPNCYKFDCFPISLFCQIYFSLFTHLVSFHLKRTSCKKALSWSPAIQCQSCALILAIWYFNEILDYQQEYIGCRLYLPSCYLKVAGKWLTSKSG